MIFIKKKIDYQNKGLDIIEWRKGIPSGQIKDVLAVHW